MTSHNLCHFLIPILFDTLYSTFNTVVTKSTTLSIFSNRNIQKGSNYFASENEGEAGQQQLLQVVEVLNKKSRRLKVRKTLLKAIFRQTDIFKESC